MCATRIELMTNTMGTGDFGNASDLSVEADLWAATANHEKPRSFSRGHIHNLDEPRDLPRINQEYHPASQSLFGAV